MHSLVDCFSKIAADPIYAHGGVVNKFLGDGFVALFGIPISLEDHATHAVQAALDIQNILRQRRTRVATFNAETILANDKAALEAFGSLQVRIGINTGVVVVGTIGNDYADYTAIGDPMNIAARLQQIADPGTVYVSESTFRLVRENFSCRPLGLRAVKGKSERIPVYIVIDQECSTTKSFPQPKLAIRSPILGRDKEIEALTGAIDDLQCGRGKLLLITGEAGIGKSRLLAEVKRLAADKNLLWREGRSRSFGQTRSYTPFQDIVRFDSRIQRNDDNDASWRKLQHRLGELFQEETAEILPYLAVLLNIRIQDESAEKVKYLNAQALGHQIFRSTRLYFDRLAQEQPLFLVFEDFHWIDSSSSELLQHIFSLIESRPIVICIISRSETDSQPVRAIKAALTLYSRQCQEITLAALAPFDCGVLLRNLLKSNDLTPSLVELISHKAEGNPLFIEEVVLALMDIGGVAHDGLSGGWRITEKAHQVSIPDSIQALIRARIDRLRDDLKHTIKTASVLGRNFLYRVLSAVDGPTFGRLQSLVELEQLELIRERNKFPELEYSFKHALVHDSAYDSIVHQRRRELHHLAAVALEELYADRLHEFYGAIAYHYAKADDSEQARAYLLKLADQASSIAADAEALEHYQQALSAYQNSLDTESARLERAVLERKIGEALFRRGHHDTALECLNRALSFLRSVNPFTSSTSVRVGIVKEIMRQLAHRWMSKELPRQALRQVEAKYHECVNVYFAMAWIHYFSDRERYLLSVLLTLNSAETSGNSHRAIAGLSALGSILDVLSFPGIAKFYHKRAINLAETEHNLVAIGHAHLLFAMHNHYQGRWSEALEGYEISAASFKNAGHIRGWGAATSCRAWILNSRGDLSKNLILANELRQLGRDAGDSQVLGWGLAHLGKITPITGGSQLEAIGYIEEALRILETIPDVHTIAAIRVDLGDIYLRSGQLEKSIQVLQDACHLIDQKHLRSFFIAPSQALLAQSYLAATEVVKPKEQNQLLNFAWRACRRSFKQMRYCPAIAPLVYRVRGGYEWLRGNPTNAQLFWQRSLASADNLGAKYESAKTYFDKGKYTGSAEDVSQADRIFTEIGAIQDLRAVENLKSRETKSRQSI
jgi:class 3 adenylate cyclase/tetratricopeptide (TPR) repeat protein